VAFADQDFWHSGGSIDQDQRGGVDRAAIRVMVGFLLRTSGFAHRTLPPVFASCS
jgi:hypothetical protein